MVELGGELLFQRKGDGFQLGGSVHRRENEAVHLAGLVELWSERRRALLKTFERHRLSLKRRLLERGSSDATVSY